MTTGIRTMQCTQATYRLGKDVALALRALVQFKAYRPELHYMRGPGPKWHAKHDLALASLRTPDFRRSPTNLGDARQTVG